jgi:hypothetical protein
MLFYISFKIDIQLPDAIEQESVVQQQHPRVVALYVGGILAV